MWKSGAVSVLLILLFGSGNFLTVKRVPVMANIYSVFLKNQIPTTTCGIYICVYGFFADRTNASVSCQMLESCDVPGFTNWYKVGRHCVIYVKQALNFTDAEFNCRTKVPGGHLVSVHDRKDNDQLISIVHKENPSELRVWLGGFKFFETGQFFWIDGTFWNFQFWGPSEPNNLYTKLEECLEMNWRDKGNWNDESCFNKKNYICAFKPQDMLGADP